jgi:hypothetical protein
MLGPNLPKVFAEVNVKVVKVYKLATSGSTSFEIVIPLPNVIPDPMFIFRTSICDN